VRMRGSLLRGVVAGAVGTAAMSASEWTHVCAHRRWWPEAEEPIDYDVSDHVVTAAAKVLPFRIRTDGQARLLFVLVHVGYGSAFGTLTEVLGRTRLSPRAQAGIFWASTEMFAFSLFPLLGETPPPWRWRAEPLVACVLQHAVYAVVTVLARESLLPAKQPA
jgi:hypothetical protein